jgi:hypothetical protein
MAKHATGESTDYLAVIMVGVGSCWGRSPDRSAAIKNAIRAYKQDAGSIFKISKGDEIIVNVVDVAPHNEVWWDSRGIWVGEERLDRKIEQVRHIL